MKNKPIFILIGLLTFFIGFLLGQQKSATQEYSNPENQDPHEYMMVLSPEMYALRKANYYLDEIQHELGRYSGAWRVEYIPLASHLLEDFNKLSKTDDRFGGPENYIVTAGSFTDYSLIAVVPKTYNTEKANEKIGPEFVTGRDELMAKYAYMLVYRLELKTNKILEKKIIYVGEG